MKNSYSQTEHADTSKEDQMELTKALRTVTYKLRMKTQTEKVRWISQKH